MDQVKIQVLGADGKYRGGLFKDGPAYRNRWTGAPKPSLQEVMICGDDDMRTGEWFLIEYVLPRQIIGDAACDSLFDEGSVCCHRTPVQALHWFVQQSFGPPPALVERVRSFAAQWGIFCGRGSARSMLAMLARGKFVDAGDPQFLDEKADDLTLLREIEVVRESRSSGAVSYSADSIVQEMGVDGFIAWMNGHLARVAGALTPKNGDTQAPAHRTAGTGSTGSSSAAAKGEIAQPAGSQSASHAYFFRDGDGWTVQFGGHRAIIKDSKGMQYLQRLLRQPGTPIAATDLGGMEPARRQGEQVVIDQDMARRMKRRLLEIANQLEDPQALLLQEERDSLERERTEIFAETSKAKPLGRARVMKSEQGAVQGSVRSAIRRAMGTLKERHEPIWKHLESSLIDPDGTAPCYRPSLSITWMVNE